MAGLCMQQKRLLQLGFLLAVADAAFVVVESEGSRECPPCGKIRVPYPLSTSPSCGHPLYRLMTCTPKNQLQVNTLSGKYTVQSLDPSTRTMVIKTGAFLGDSCITKDSISAQNFSLTPGSSLSIAPRNTVLLLNASDALRFSPLNCRPEGPCRLLPLVPQRSCHTLFCCSFVTDGRFYRYYFPSFGLETGYVSMLDVPANLGGASAEAPRRVKFGLRLQWEVPMEPPCETEAQCGGNSTCVRARVGREAPAGIQAPAPPDNICACNHGYQWDPSTGTCPEGSTQRERERDRERESIGPRAMFLAPSTQETPNLVDVSVVYAAPFCIRNSGSIACHKAQYATGLTLGITGIIALISLTVCWFKRRRRAQRAHAKLMNEWSMILATNSGGKSARLFTKEEMKRATNNFARDRVLGSGGFGEVYRGVLDDDTVVAIKSAKIGNSKGIDQILNEVRILSQVNHRSLVRLLGCCVESEVPLLVYEYVPNGDLSDHLVANSSMLDWKTRLRIAFQSAEGLAYLHSAAYPPIYHRDVKPSNILLDESMNARVADFGVSRLADPDLTHVSTYAQGTIGYLDPEYYYSYQLSDKSDVYSFGVVLLELVTSQKAIDFSRSEDEVNLAVMVQIMKNEGKTHEVLDLKLVNRRASKETVNSMTSVVDLALECLQENRLNRPSMKEVAKTLHQTMLSLEIAESLC